MTHYFFWETNPPLASPPCSHPPIHPNPLPSLTTQFLLVTAPKTPPPPLSQVTTQIFISDRSQSCKAKKRLIGGVV